MRIVSQRDVIFGVITGLIAGVSVWRILVFLSVQLPMHIPLVAPVVALPVLWVVGVQLGYALGALWRPLTQFGRFAAVGFANAGVDFGILYLLIAATGHASGWWYPLFKAASFCVSVVHSYLWNKYWVFSAGESTTRGETLRFVTVALAAIIVNVSVASLAVVVRPPHIDAHAWAGIAAVIGAASALFFSFAGFRLFVFAKK